MKDRRNKGQILFRAARRKTTIAVPTGPLRGTAVLSADAAAGTAGACGMHAFAASECVLNPSGNTLSCK